MYRDNLGLFSFDVAKRILDALISNGHIAKTKLALKTGLNYNTCIRYIRMLERLGWVARYNSSTISITLRGREVSEKLVSSDSIAAIRNVPITKKDVESSSSLQTSVVRSGDLGQHAESLSHRDVIKGNKDAGEVVPKRVNKNVVTIMLVDDEQDILLTYESFLSSAGYSNIDTFSDSYEALRNFAADPRHYDLVILDIRMDNDINGLQLYQSFKAMNSNVKAMFVSSLDAARELVSLLPGTRLEDVIRKPVSKERFVDATMSILLE